MSLDPNGDGNFDDRANVINMSLGSDGSPTDDPENDIVDNLTKQGVLSVVASAMPGCLRHRRFAGQRPVCPDRGEQRRFPGGHGPD